MRARLYLLVPLSLALACTGGAQRGSARDTTGTVSPGDSAVGVDSVRIQRPTDRPRAAADSARPQVAITVPRQKPDTSVTVAEIAASNALVGKRVRVTGRCMGYSTPLAVGPPPQTRSDWQLADGGTAIYVVGTFPPGCSPTTGSSEPVTIIGVVTEDTLPARMERPARARRYMVRDAQ
ncbi:MAG TPA: hypothetical protein VJ755_13345 [Gemmatimonadales bacterium]|nr:hypothetical protein [Gemmatimonadales bacterium]